jgi:cell division protein FtsB
MTEPAKGTEKQSKFQRFLEKAKGTHFYLIPIALTVTYATLVYIPTEQMSNSIKLIIVAVTGVAVFSFLYLWIVLSEVPNRYNRLRFRELQLDTKETEFKKRQDDLEGHISKLQSRLDHLKHPIRYRQFRREIMLSKDHIGESEQTWVLNIENISDQDIYEFTLPSRNLDLYDAFKKGFAKFEKDTTLSPEEKIRRTFTELEQVLEAKIGDKSLEKTALSSLLFDLTVQHRRFSLRGSYVDELTAAGEGDVAEVTYKIPLEGEDRLKPTIPKTMTFKVYNKCAFLEVLKDEVTSLKVEHVYDEAVITVECPEGHELIRNRVKGTDNGLKVLDSVAKTQDKDELNRSCNIHVDQNRRRIVWTIQKPKIGYVYLMHFKMIPAEQK